MIRSGLKSLERGFSRYNLPSWQHPNNQPRIHDLVQQWSRRRDGSHDRRETPGKAFEI
jgi:hypothetical protein